MRVLRYGGLALLVGVVGCETNQLVNPPLPVEAPDSLYSISLNGAIALSWTDNALRHNPDFFELYRVYSTSYNLDTGFCGTSWSVEGTTVAPEFLVGALQNGVPRCFGVTAQSLDGTESVMSPLRQDTPRPDARNVVVYAYQADSLLSGFRFWDDVNGDGRGQLNELGLIQNGNRTDIDFWVFRGTADSLWIVPEFSGTSMRFYSAFPVGDLTDIDFAPAGGYSRNMFLALPGYGYVFQIIDGTSLHYGALRVTQVGRDYLIFDWSVQTDPGNPELLRSGGQTTAMATGSTVKTRVR